MRFLNHPLHPMLAHFPLVCWTLPVGADMAFWMTRDPFWLNCATWLLAAGLGFSVLAILAGIAELGQLSRKPQAEGAMSLHVLCMVGACVAAGVSLVGRLRQGYPLIEWPTAVGVLACILVLAGSYFGGRLVYEFQFGQRQQRISHEH